MRSNGRIRAVAVAVLVAATIGAGISPIVAGAAGAAGAATTPTLQGRGSVDEAWLTGAAPGDHITLMQQRHRGGQPGQPGNGRLARLADHPEPHARSRLPLGRQHHRPADPRPSRCWRPGSNPGTDSSLYTGQPMHQGLNYITMRDGIQLAATVRYPYGETCSSTSPCPTVIEYSGLQRGRADRPDPVPPVRRPSGPRAPTAATPTSSPTRPPTWARCWPGSSGFATVSLQMRGTGCSGGAFDLFGYPSDYDAYDAIEIVAHQAWVANHKVGMVGISYSGLSQFPSAGTDPPGLAAIAPMSPTDDLFSTGYPGGIYNDGFAASWIGQRIDDAMAAATYSGGQLAPLATTPVTNVGQPWTYYEIDAELAASDGASSTCLANQALHDQSESLDEPGRAPAGGAGHRPGPRPVPVRPPVDDRLGQAHQGAGLPLRRPPGRADRPAVAGADRRHPEDHAGVRQHGQRRPHRLDRPPDHQPLARVPRHLRGRQGARPSRAPWPPSSSTSSPASPRARRPRRRSRPSGSPRPRTWPRPGPSSPPRRPLVQVLFDNGAGAAGPGDPQSTYSADFSSWPPAGTVETLHFGPDGSLHGAAPSPAVERHLHPGPDGPPADQPPVQRQRLGGRPRLGLDAGARRRRHRLPDHPVHEGHHHRGPGHARPLGQVGHPGRGLPGHHHRGPALGRPGGVRHLGVPAQLEPGRQPRLHRPVHRPDLPGRRRQRPVARPPTRW